MSFNHRDLSANCAIVALAISLAACGGGGTTNIAPSPTPIPAPSPRSEATAAELSQEAERSNGVTSSKAETAHARGITGAGELIAVMDTGAVGFLQNLSDNSSTGPDAPDSVFGDRLSPASRPLWGTDTPGDFTQHGTLVTAAIGAARDGRGMQGVAYGADLIYYDYGDYCLATTCTEEQWQESFERYRVGMQDAIERGATVINFSLGEDRFPTRMIPTTQNAVAADMVIVISAGNEGQNDPHAMAQGFANLAPDHTIIAGAMTANRQPASFTNLAGVSQDNYLMALGVGVVTYDNQGRVVTANGTSLSAPIITGAVALLAEAFPTLSGAQIVDILFESADDVGAPGIDAIFGRGILNIERAMQPLGTTSVAGSTITTRELIGGVASPAFGDASGQIEGLAITDKYGRPFLADIGGFAQQTGTSTPLQSLSQNGIESHALSLGESRVAFTTATTNDPRKDGPSQLVAAEVEMKIGETTRLAFAKGVASDRLLDKAQNAFLLAGRAQRDGMQPSETLGVAARRNLGGMDLIMSAERGEFRNDWRRWRESDGDPYRQLRIGMAREMGPLKLEAGLSQIDETNTVLGGAASFASGGAISQFIDGKARLDLGQWQLSGDVRFGRSQLDAVGDFVRGGALRTRGWSLAMARDGFALRFSQPMRVTQGGWQAFIPNGYDYSAPSPTYGGTRIGLAPSGRETNVEAVWGGRIAGMRVDTNLYWRGQPGHIAAAPDDKGAAIRLSGSF